MRIKFILFFASAIVLFTCCNPSKKAQRQVNENLADGKTNKTLNATELYFLKYKDIAIEEMERTGIPASITLSQAVLESGNGNSDLAVKANNHFGIKCKGKWTGATIYMDDDEKNECFRSYQSTEESFKDHSDFLKANPRYRSLFSLDGKDYKSWAYGLKEAGYATRRDYAEMLIDIIEKNKLYKLDMGEEVNPANKQDTQSKITINRIPVVVARKGDTYESIAAEMNIDPDDILKYNEVSNKVPVHEGSYVFLKHKKNKAQETYHIFRKGDDLYSISQLYGIKLKRIYELNQIDQGRVPEIGEIIYLKYMRTRPARTMSQLQYDNILAKPPVVYTDSNNVYKSVNHNDSITIDNEARDNLDKLASNKAIISKVDSTKKISVNENNDSHEISTKTSEYHIVQKGETLFSIAKKYNIPVVDLMSINNLSDAAIKVFDTIYLRKPEKVVIVNKPQENMKTGKDTNYLLAGKNIIQKPFDTVYHVVKPGEDLYSISGLYSINIIDLININKIDVYELNNGQKLIVKIIDNATGKNILSKGPVHQKEKQEVKTQNKSENQNTNVNPPKNDNKPVETEDYHIVQPGETLYRIAVNHQTTVDKIRKLNGLKDNTIKVGQKLLIRQAQ